MVYRRMNIDVHLQEQLPENREHQSLETIGEDPSLQSTTEQAADTIGGDDSFGSLPVSNTPLMHLSISLDDT